MKYSAIATAVVVGLATPVSAFLSCPLRGSPEGKLLRRASFTPRDSTAPRSPTNGGYLDNEANDHESAPMNESYPPITNDDEPTFATYVDQMGRSFPPIKKALLSPGPNKQAKMNPALGGPGVGVAKDCQSVVTGTMVAPPPPEEPEIVYSKPAQTFQAYMEQIGDGATARARKGRYAPRNGKKYAPTAGIGMGNFVPGSQQVVPETPKIQTVANVNAPPTFLEPSSCKANTLPATPAVAEIAAKAFAPFLNRENGNVGLAKKASYMANGMGSYWSNVASGALEAQASYSVPEPTNISPIFDYSLEQASGGSSAYFSSGPSNIYAPTRNLASPGPRGESGMGGYLESL